MRLGILRENAIAGASGLSLFAILVCAGPGSAAELPLPARPQNAPTGSQLAARWSATPLGEREIEIEAEILRGNVPGFVRQLQPVLISSTDAGRSNSVRIEVTQDYLGVGSDADYFLVPMTPRTAQRIADRLGCSLPTPRMVDAIYRSAELKMEPLPLPPGRTMTTVSVFKHHSDLFADERARRLHSAEPNRLTAGHKKDVVISNRLTNAPGQVAIYGWHRTNGVPIQPLYVGHSADWVDYSHGVRLVATNVTVNGRPGTLGGILQTPHLCSLLSHEGLMFTPRYQTADESERPPVNRAGPRPRVRDEQEQELELDPDVRVKLIIPNRIQATQPWYLVVYALPNGNTIEQTIGKRLSPGDDWHFDIQHIGAQMQFVRSQSTNANWAIAYLEAEGRSWPGWRRRVPDASRRIRDLVERLVSRQEGEGRPVRLVLAGHSGGGSFIFGYLDSVAALPDNLERMAFLDANYAYEPTAGHASKLARWLVQGTNRYLTVLAYHDSAALLEGKPFVSAAGGTWGRSHLMLTNLASWIEFRTLDRQDLIRHTALEGRVQFLLKPNPERKVLHTVQVERNGFIHAMLAGTPKEDSGYSYFGPRAYEAWIEP